MDMRGAITASVLRWETEGVQILSNFPKVTQHITDIAEIPAGRSTSRVTVLSLIV